MGLDFNRYDEIEYELLGHARRHREHASAKIGIMGTVVTPIAAEVTAHGIAMLYTKGSQRYMCSTTDCDNCVLSSKWRNKVGVVRVKLEASCDAYVIEGEDDLPLRRLPGLVEIARSYGFLDTVIRKIMEMENE